MKMAVRDCILCVRSRKRKIYVSWVEIIFSRKFGIGINNARTGFGTSVLWIWFQINLEEKRKWGEGREKKHF